MSRTIKRVPLDFEHEGVWPGYVCPNENEYEDWEEEHPPEGPGYQIWETVSEGSPVSPVFATKRECIEYLHENGAGATFKPCSRAAARDFVESGWAMSAGSVGTGLVDGINLFSHALCPALRDYDRVSDQILDLVISRYSEFNEKVEELLLEGREILEELIKEPTNSVSYAIMDVMDHVYKQLEDDYGMIYSEFVKLGTRLCEIVKAAQMR